MDGDRPIFYLTEILQMKNDHLGKNHLERAIKAAVTNRHHVDVSKLVVKGATSIDEALKVAVQMKNYYATSLLLLVFAAMNGNRQRVIELFEEPPMAVLLPEGVTLSVEDMEEVQKAVTSGQVSNVLFEIAQGKRQDGVHEELFLYPQVKQEMWTVNWDRQALLSIELSWIMKIQWVKRLHLGHNRLLFIPSNVGQYLNHVST